MLLRQLGGQVLIDQWRGMKRNLSLLTKEIMQLRLDAENQSGTAALTMYSAALSE
jgi:hypothetical protein